MDGLFFPHKVGRLSFVVRNVVMNGTVWPIIVLLGDGPTGSGPTSEVGFWLFVAIVLAYWLFFVALPRCRDAGLPWWTLLLLPVPVVGIGVSLVLLGTGTKPEVLVGTEVEYPHA